MTHPRLNTVESEIRRAYNGIVETGVCYFWDRSAIPGVYAHEVITLYKHSLFCHENNLPLAAERWARAAKHLSQAYWHEAKIAYLGPRVQELPSLPGASGTEYGIREHSDSTPELLESISKCIPSGDEETLTNMKRYLARAYKHLESLGIENELLKAERSEAAYEYGRTLECMTLAHEAETAHKAA